MSRARNVAFVDLCGRGDASPDQIDDFIELWHEGGSGLSLHEFLGMSWDEYSAWVLNPGLLPRIIAAHREARAS
jgi:hypothetical protein